MHCLNKEQFKYFNSYYYLKGIVYFGIQLDNATIKSNDGTVPNLKRLHPTRIFSELPRILNQKKILTTHSYLIKSDELEITSLNALIIVANVKDIRKEFIKLHDLSDMSTV